MEETHPWNEKLDLGHEPIDHEHHLQIALVGALADAIERGRPWLARRLVDQLSAYTAAHFRGEELLMETTGYRLLGAHREEHRELLAQIDEVRSLLTCGEYDLALPMTLDVRSALCGHVATSDRRFGEHVGEPTVARR
jgi:hemerythrin